LKYTYDRFSFEKQKEDYMPIRITSPNAWAKYIMGLKAAHLLNLGHCKLHGFADLRFVDQSLQKTQ
jgi:hypothetical protein